MMQMRMNGGLADRIDSGSRPAAGVNEALLQRRSVLIAAIIHAAGVAITDDETNAPISAESYAVLSNANNPMYVGKVVLLSIEYGNIKGVGYLPTSVLARYPFEDGGVRHRRYAFKINKDVYDAKKVHKLYRQLLAIESKITENLARWLTCMDASIDCLSNFGETKTPDFRSMGAISVNDYAGYVALDPEGVAENAAITYTWETTMAGWLVTKVNIDIPAPANRPAGKKYEFFFDITIPNGDATVILPRSL